LGKAACTFKETDLTRAFKAAKKAGVDVQVVIDLRRNLMRITPLKPGEASERNEWDEMYGGTTQTEAR
jgi:hypothetical protein